MEEIQENITTVEELVAKYPTLTKQIKDTASLEAAKAENERMKAIDEIAGQISAEMVQDAKYGEKKVTAEVLAFEAFKRNGIMERESLVNMKEDIADSGADGVGATMNVGLLSDTEELDRETKVQNLANKFKRK